MTWFICYVWRARGREDYQYEHIITEKHPVLWLDFIKKLSKEDTGTEYEIVFALNNIPPLKNTILEVAKDTKKYWKERYGGE
jgi:hypothetical protein